MRVLVSCERSGVVREAFRRRGHDAWSNDLAPAMDGSPHHLIGDAIEVSRSGDWDLMIAHPPCTHLAVSGARWFKTKQVEQREGIWFFLALANAPVPRIAVENPVGIMSTIWRRPDQIIQPWQFGHPESKATCLWLKGLPLLVPTSVLKKPARGHWDNQTPSGQNKLGPSPERWMLRSKTYIGIAEAMASQWG